MLLCHPSLGLQDHLALLNASECRILLHPVDDISMSASILQHWEMRTVAVPQLDKWFESSDTPPALFMKTLIEAWNDPFAIVHSSGTTGAPKLIQLTHGSVATAARCWSSKNNFPTLFHLWTGLRVLMTFPISLAVGVFCMLSVNVQYEWIVVLPPPLPSTAKLLDTVHRHADVQVLASLPRVYPDLANNAHYLENLRRLQYVAYSGGPCQPGAGSKIASKTRLVTLLGSSETGPILTEALSAEDWEYTKFSAAVPHRLEHAIDEFYELVILREGDEAVRSSQPVFCTCPELSEYRTKDLYSQHPVKAGLWRWRGRKDDMITLTSPSRPQPTSMLPVPMEDAVTASPGVKSSLVLGSGRSCLVPLVA